MKIKTDVLLSALSDTLKATKENATNPTLAYIKIEKDTDSNRCSLVGTNMEFTVGRTIDVEGNESVSLLIDGRKIHDIISSVPDEYITVTILSQKIKVSSSISELTLSTLVADDFPKVDNGGERAALVSSDSLALWREAMWCTSSDVHDTFKNGVNLTFDKSGKSIHVETGNGFRCSILKCPAQEVYGNFNALVPVNNLIKMMSLAVEDVFGIFVSSSYIVFQSKNGFTRSALIEAKFPEWLSKIKKTTLVGIKVDRDSTLQSLKSALIVAKDSANKVILTWDNTQIHIHAESETGNVDLHVPHKGLIGDQKVSFKIGFDCISLRDALTFGGDVTMWLTSSDLYARFSREKDDWIGVVMPRKVSQ